MSKKRKARQTARRGRPPKFRSRLRSLRERRGKTLEEVAQATGLSAPTVARVEAGRNAYSQTIDALSCYYRRDVRELRARPP